MVGGGHTGSALSPLRIGGFLQRERFGSQSVNGVRTNLGSHEPTWRSGISQNQQIKTNNKQNSGRNAWRKLLTLDKPLCPPLGVGF